MANYQVIWTQKSGSGSKGRHSTIVQAASIAEAKAKVKGSLPFSQTTSYSNFIAVKKS